MTKQAQTTLQAVIAEMRAWFAAADSGQKS